MSSLIEWQKFRPLHKWVLVKADPRVKKTSGGILLTDEIIKVERVMEGTGKILKAGKEALEDVSVGERICYRGFLKDAFCDTFEKEDDCDIFILRIEDVLAVIPDDIEMGEFSGVLDGAGSDERGAVSD
jgi:co-chaperonin GroES (HSP10)